MRARDGGVENENEGCGEWRMRARDGGSGDNWWRCSETGLVMDGKKMYDWYRASLTMGYRDKEDKARTTKDKTTTTRTGD